LKLQRLGPVVSQKVIGLLHQLPPPIRDVVFDILEKLVEQHLVVV